MSFNGNRSRAGLNGRQCNSSPVRPAQVPTLVPKSKSPTVTQEHLPNRKSDALRALGLPWVMLDCEICLLKIRVSRKEQRYANRLLPRFSTLGEIPLLATLYIFAGLSRVDR